MDILTWFFIIGIIINIIFSIAVTEDALSRGHTEIWGAIVLIFGIVGVVFYILVRNPEVVNPKQRCAGCNKIYYKDHRIERHESNSGHDFYQK